MYALFVLVTLALIALAVVSVINRKQEKERARRFQQRRLRIRADALNDMVSCLEQTLPNPVIVKYINDEIIVLCRQILELEDGMNPRAEASLRAAIAHSEELMSGNQKSQPRYQKDSDAQVAQTLSLLNEAGALLRHLCAQGKLSDIELDSFLTELGWAHLMVSVQSYIGQGYKFSALQDRLTAQNYYQRAHTMLLESLHGDSRRVRMIKELSEMLDGSRKSMSMELMP